MRFFASCPKSLEELLAAELTAMGATGVKQTIAGVHFEGGMDLAYRACLWSRLASRILLPLLKVDDADNDSLYAQTLNFPWEDHIDPRGTIAVDAHGTNEALRNSQYSAQRLKDAICDRLRSVHQARPDIETRDPDVRIHLFVRGSIAQISLDMSGSPLHQRGYRHGSNDAPLKENLGAALLIRAGWPAIAAAGGALVDPFCGSGTLLIEGAWMAADMAPGLRRDYFGFLGWKKFDAETWRALRDEASARAELGRKNEAARYFGSDRDAAMIGAARANAEHAGVSELILFRHERVEQLQRPQGFETGLVLSNPPYGERMGDNSLLVDTYKDFGTQLHPAFAGWKAAFITSDPALSRATGLRSSKSYAFFNGAIECRLYCFEPGSEGAQWRAADPDRPLSEAALGLQNRLQKNLKHLKPRLAREGITCYRAYDADLPDYAAAIDVYEGWLHVQEYAAPKDIPEAVARRRFNELLRVASDVFEVPRERIAEKTRLKRGRLEQYTKQDEQARFFNVQEGGLKFRVNLFDYLDTGLFLDHRPLRQRVRELSRGKRFLNLFCYTGAVTIYAAAGGAASTASVDLSNTYLDWAEENLALNGYANREQRLVQGDAMRFIEKDSGEYDLIYVDPPTFSNSKSADDFDVQRDHVRLLQACAARLAAGGLILFSNNNRRFKIDREALSGLEIVDISKRTIPFDFARNERIHHCFEIRRAP
jgi:23S rRNA (guanine2445-N2)-methyltransferase / 23S rRNA (guanine2069-N7)-methyltransferase